MDVAVAPAELAAVCGVIGAGTELAAAGAAVAQASACFADADGTSVAKLCPFGDLVQPGSRASRPFAKLYALDVNDLDAARLAALVRSENAGRLDDATPLPVRWRRLPGELGRVRHRGAPVLGLPFASSGSR